MSFLVELNLLLMSFLIIYAMCDCIDLIMDAMFWYGNLMEDSIWEKIDQISFFKFWLQISLIEYYLTSNINDDVQYQELVQT
jgi:hypothetical protein